MNVHNKGSDNKNLVKYHSHSNFMMRLDKLTWSRTVVSPGDINLDFDTIDYILTTMKNVDVSTVWSNQTVLYYTHDRGELFW
jgi:hypothetical protein